MIDSLSSKISSGTPPLEAARARRCMSLTFGVGGFGDTGDSGGGRMGCANWGPDIDPPRI